MSLIHNLLVKTIIAFHPSNLSVDAITRKWLVKSETFNTLCERVSVMFLLWRVGSGMSFSENGNKCFFILFLMNSMYSSIPNESSCNVFVFLFFYTTARLHYVSHIKFIDETLKFLLHL